MQNLLNLEINFLTFMNKTRISDDYFQIILLTKYNFEQNLRDRLMKTDRLQFFFLKKNKSFNMLLKERKL